MNQDCLKWQRKLFWDKCATWFRACLSCGQMSWHGYEQFCNACMEELMPWRLPHNEAFKAFDDAPFLHRAAYLWTRESDYILRPFIYSFKSGRCLHALYKYAEEWCWQTKNHGHSAYIFTAPSSSYQSTDHAWAWGHCLRQIWNWPMFSSGVGLQLDNKSDDCANQLFQQEQVNQKCLSRAQRWKRKLFCQPEALNKLRIYLQIDPDVYIIFADDVVTTGATAFAAYQALGQPKNFEVWSLVYRPLIEF